MLRNTALLSALFGVVTLLSCSDDDGPGQFRYPLQVGREWFYTRTWYSVDDDSTVEILDHGVTIVRIVGIEALPQVGDAVWMDISYDNGSFVYTGREYYQNRDDGLYRVAYCGSVPSPTPKLQFSPSDHARLSMLLSGEVQLPLSPCDEPLTIEEEDRLALPNPIRTGKPWVFLPIPQLTIIKEVTGWTHSTTPAGEWDAYNVEWSYPNLTTVTMTDQIASVGLLRRTARYKDVQVTTHQHPDIPILVDQFDELVLDSLRS